MGDVEQIISRSDLFAGELVDKPKLASIALYGPDGEPLWKCPNCGNVAGEDDCGILGAEPGCMFCNQCNREFEMP